MTKYYLVISREEKTKESFPIIWNKLPSNFFSNLDDKYLSNELAVDENIDILLETVVWATPIESDSICNNPIRCIISENTVIVYDPK